MDKEEIDKNVIDIDNLANESDEMLFKELSLLTFDKIKKPLVDELYHRTNQTTLFKKENLELILSTTKWRYFIFGGVYPSGGEWTPYPVKLPDILQEVFYEHLYTIRLYEYRAKIIDLEKRLETAKLDIEKNPKAYILCMALEKELKGLRGGVK